MSDFSGPIQKDQKRFGLDPSREKKDTFVDLHGYVKGPKS